MLGPQLFSIYMKLPAASSKVKENKLQRPSRSLAAADLKFMRPVQVLTNRAVDPVYLSVLDICIWISKHFLKLNDTETEVFVIGSR